MPINETTNYGFPQPSKGDSGDAWVAEHNALVEAADVAIKAELDTKPAHSLATAISDFLVASGAGVWVKKTLAEVKTILGLGTAAYTAATAYLAHSLATAANDFVVASGSGVFVKKTLLETKTLLGALGNFYVIAVNGGDTMSREENVAGLSSAITLCTEIRLDMIAHYANATRHVTGQQSSAAFGAVPPTLASLLVTAGTLLTAYAAHNADAILPSGWAYHNQQATTKALTSAVTPTTLQEAVTRLNDLKAKYNDHEDETTGHNSTGTVAADQVGAADAAYGATNRVPIAATLAGDVVSWAVLKGGTGSVTGDSYASGAAYVDFTFSADPQNDAIISYIVTRAI